MVARIDIDGQRFGRWSVLSRATPSPRHRTVYWQCRCDCGEIRDVCGSRLRTNKSVSCGCLGRETASAVHSKHGLYGTRTYRIWKGIVQRTTNPKSPDFRRYGGRGITLCPSWRDFSVFFADMGECPGELTIERIDNNGPYAPQNCKWASVLEQASNRSVNRFITHDGKKQSVSQWARELGIKPITIFKRLDAGWLPYLALTTSVAKRKL